MQELTASDSFVVRPGFKVAVTQVVVIDVLILITLFGVTGMRAVCAKLLPGKTFPPEPVSLTIFMLAVPLSMLFPYLGSRKRYWVVSAEGVETYFRGKIQRRIPWSEVVSVEACPLGAIIRHAGGPKRGEQLACLGLAESRRLRKMWRQIHPPARPKAIPASHLIRFTLGCGLLSLLCIPPFLAFSHLSVVRALCGGTGVLAALHGVGIGFWAAWRLRNMRLLISTCPAALALSGWVWTHVAWLQRLAQ